MSGKTRLWAKACGGPAVLGLLGYLIFGLVEYLHPGTYAGQFRVEVLYVGLTAFYIAIAWTIRNLWIVLRAYWGKGKGCADCGFPVTRKQIATHVKCWGCGSKVDV